eukprot:XP_001705702.1 Hypothetical protein GL50803_12244 [Giardia lamblia ATCC 50803]
MVPAGSVVVDGIQVGDADDVVVLVHVAELRVGVGVEVALVLAPDALALLADDGHGDADLEPAVRDEPHLGPDLVCELLGHLGAVLGVVLPPAQPPLHDLLHLLVGLLPVEPFGRRRGTHKLYNA